ncbi:MAG: hypothetical protein IJA82_07975 [Clostridia bacterium]|nr:hypothetical protein [Clostridia bacterium]
MQLKAKLKLQLPRQRIRIEATYNTFEKATYDQYLCASIALRSQSKDHAYEYIDDITGSGSLNAHFKSLYDDARKLTDEQLKEIMSSSLYPVLKKDNRNYYEYYETFNISIYNKKIYKGYMGDYTKEEIKKIIHLDKEILELSHILERQIVRPEAYEVTFDDDNISVKLSDGTEPIKIESRDLELSLAEGVNNIDIYKGSIIKHPEGDGWKILTDSALSVLDKSLHYYDEGKHYEVLQNEVKETIVAEFAGLYLFKKLSLSYKGSFALCKQVIDFLLDNNKILNFKPNNIINILEYCELNQKQKVINYVLSNKYSMEYAIQGIKLARNGFRENWLPSVLKMFLKQARSSEDIESIYLCNSDIDFELKDLLKINKSILTPKHLAIVIEHQENEESKRNVIRKIIGDVTTKGLRERCKDLKDDDDKKSFKNLCNDLIGHNKKSIESLEDKELDDYLSKAYKLEKLSKLIEEKLNKLQA